MRRSRAYRSAGFLRSLTLLRTFLVASAAILAVGAFTLSSILSQGLREHALADNARDVEVFVDGAVAPRVVRGSRPVRSPKTLERRLRILRLPAEMRGLNVWSREGRLLYSARDPGQVGRQRAGSATIRRVLRTGMPVSFVAEGRGGNASVKIWTPVRTSSGKPVAAAEVTLDERVLERAVAASQHTIWLAVAIVFGLLWLVLAVLVRGASARMHSQNEDLQARSRELTETTRTLEQTLLETIETLNAAVEARDPYTAGHSHRVRRVALAIGRELALSPKRLGILGTAALFHDVGKIGMPDSILTKPDQLTPAESAVMREHVIRGSEIVSRISSLRDAVPAIRHHHERWDGLGYPNGLTGEDIPLEATIIGLADAWDAMTTDRPYASALQLNEAMTQVRAGRGKQFNPAVVDAFWAVARRRPAEVLPPDEATATVAVV